MNSISYKLLFILLLCFSTRVEASMIDLMADLSNSSTFYELEQENIFFIKEMMVKEGGSDFDRLVAELYKRTNNKVNKYYFDGNKLPTKYIVGFLVALSLSESLPDKVYMIRSKMRSYFDDDDVFLIMEAVSKTNPGYSEQESLKVKKNAVEQYNSYGISGSSILLEVVGVVLGTGIIYLPGGGGGAGPGVLSDDVSISP